MKELNIKLNNKIKYNPVILIDDKIIKVKKNKFGNYTYKHTTNSDFAEIKVLKILEVNNKLWFFMEMLFFIISIFGILEIPYDKKCVVLDCKLKLKLNEVNNITLIVNNSSESDKAVDIESDCEIEEEKNIKYVDTIAKKRLKILKRVKIGFWIALILAIILTIILVTIL